MNKPIVIYDEARGKILAKYVENFGKVCEVDVTDQTLQAVFRYLMAYGLTLAEHCEYEVDGNKFRTSLVKQEAPTVDLVKHGRWLETNDDNKKRCSVCDRICFIAIYPWFFGMAHYCPSCGAEMESDDKE